MSQKQSTTKRSNSPSHHGLTRRSFVKSAALTAAAVPTVITSFSLFGAGGQPGPNDRINVAIIGMGKRGNTWMIPNYLQKMELRLVAICDVDALKLEFAKQRADALIAEQAPKHGKYSPVTYRDFREVLARSDVDLVDITTPDHWHVPMTLRALKAGKDVVCTKPPTLGVAEGRAMVDYWKKTDRVFTSTEILVPGFVAKKLIRSGQFGKLKEVHIDRWPYYFADFPGPDFKTGPVPEGVDWDLWLGPARETPYSDVYHHHCDPATKGFNPWTKYRPFGGGHLADWCGHLMGPAVFAGDLVGENGPMEVKVYLDRPKAPDNVEPKVEWLFGNGTRVLAKKVPQEFSDRIYFVGENGDTSYAGVKKFDAAKTKATEVLDYPEQAEWTGDIAYSVRKRNRKTLRNPEFSHRLHTCAHLASISYWLGGRTIKFDPVKEEIIGDAEASALLTRQYRDPWGLEV